MYAIRSYYDNVLSVIAPSFGTRAGWGLTSGGYWFDPEKKEWIFAPTSVEFKNLLQWFNKMLKEGLLDPEFATLDSNVYEQKIMTGKTFFMLDWLGNEKRYVITSYSIHYTKLYESVKKAYHQLMLFYPKQISERSVVNIEGAIRLDGSCACGTVSAPASPFGFH